MLSTERLLTDSIARIASATPWPGWIERCSRSVCPTATGTGPTTLRTLIAFADAVGRAEEQRAWAIAAAEKQAAEPYGSGASLITASRLTSAIFASASLAVPR